MTCGTKFVKQAVKLGKGGRIQRDSSDQCLDGENGAIV